MTLEKCPQTQLGPPMTMLAAVQRIQSDYKSIILYILVSIIAGKRYNYPIFQIRKDSVREIR